MIGGARFEGSLFAEDFLRDSVSALPDWSILADTALDGLEGALRKATRFADLVTCVPRPEHASAAAVCVGPDEAIPLRGSTGPNFAPPWPIGSDELENRAAETLQEKRS